MEAFDAIIPAELALDEEPFVDDDIDRITGGYPDGPAGRWSIRDDGAAEWAMRKLAAVLAEERELEERRDEWLQKIIGWFDRRHAVLVPRRQFFEGHLERYQETRRTADPKAKTLVLPSGEVRSRLSSAKAAVENPGSFVRWAIDHAPEVLETVHKPVHRLFSERFGPNPTDETKVVDKETGEIVEVPGLATTPASVSFSAVPS